MKQYLERKCKDAGVKNEELVAVRRFFNSEAKKMQREKAFREKEGIVFNSLSALVSDVEGAMEFDITDPALNPEEVLIAKEEEKEKEANLKLLKACLAELEPDEQELLLAYYSGTYGVESALARELGVDRKKFIRTREALVKKLQRIFFEKYEGERQDLKKEILKKKK